MKFRSNNNGTGWDNVLTYNGKEGQEGRKVFESKKIVGEDGLQRHRQHSRHMT